MKTKKSSQSTTLFFSGCNHKEHKVLQTRVMTEKAKKVILDDDAFEDFPVQGMEFLKNLRMKAYNEQPVDGSMNEWEDDEVTEDFAVHLEYVYSSILIL